jgi:hypothetical protein
MNLRSAFLSLVGIVILTTVASGQDRPNFTGHWVQVSPAEGAGTEQWIKHDAETLSASHASSGADHATIHKLDGAEHKNVLTSHGSDIVTTSKAAWEGTKLSITGTTRYPDGRTRTRKEVWSIDGENRLVIDLSLTSAGEKPLEMKLVFRKG